ncbi:hypothetical protein C8Z91_20720 [Paenibacillus elgii]|uniref:Uncharacterized protein n=1 Tax=Paenibacillus elgii TaxID=189691 RepID=A0A2T6FZJ7_9BACL|nr:hypothetical protein [Paenibacillus elgii]PUA37332.1 hypothetical protein C8Z91_20720 [Paenibacillus elgii]
MLITAFVFIMIAVVLGIAFLRGFAKQLADHEDRSHENHPHHLKEAASIEAAQELYPFEETKSITRSKTEPDKKRSHLQVVPDIRGDKAKSSVQTVKPKVGAKVKSNAQTVAPKVGAKAKTNVQTVTPKVNAKAKTTVQTVTPKVDAKAKTTMQPATHKADAKAKTTVQTVTHKSDAKAKTTMKPVTPKVDAKAKTTVQTATHKVDAKAKTNVQPATHKVDAKAKTTVQPVTHKTDTKATSTVQPFSYIQVPSNIPPSFIANEWPNQPVLSQSIEDSAAVIPLSLEKQLDNIEVTESRLQINVYNTLVQQLEEASAVLAQIDKQIKFIELTNFIDDEFTKLRTSSE